MDFSTLGLSTEQLKGLSAIINSALSGQSNEGKLSSVYFTNISNKSFSHSWNNTNYEIAAGQTLLLESSIAEHLAKHLIDRMLAEGYSEQIKTGKNSIDIRVHPDRPVMISKILSNPVATANSEVELAIKTANLKQEIAEIKDQHLEAEEEVEEEEVEETEPEPIKTFVAKKKVVKKAVKKSKKSEDMEAFDEAVA